MAKQRYTLEQLIAAAIKCRGLCTLIADELCCSDETVNTYRKRYATFDEAVKRERVKRIDRSEFKLDEAIERCEPWAVSLSLKGPGKSRGYADRKEVTGADGSPIAPVPYIEVASDGDPPTATDDPALGRGGEAD